MRTLRTVCQGLLLLPALQPVAMAVHPVMHPPFGIQLYQISAEVYVDMHAGLQSAYQTH
jgi:hypothetical protein